MHFPEQSGGVGCPGLGVSRKHLTWFTMDFEHAEGHIRAVLRGFLFSFFDVAVNCADRTAHFIRDSAHRQALGSQLLDSLTLLIGLR